jgi:hypothetical protein
VDTFAMPFVQGHLRSEAIGVEIETECAHCSRSMRIELESDLRYRIAEGADPLIFVPLVDFEKLKDPSIIDAF